MKCTQLCVGDLVFLKRIAFKGKHKIQDNWDKTINWVEGQTYAGLPVSRIVPVDGEGKVKVVHWNLLLPLCGNVEDSENEESWQDINGPSYCTQAVSDDVDAETKVVLTNPEPEGKGDAIHVLCV